MNYTFLGSFQKVIQLDAGHIRAKEPYEETLIDLTI